MDQITGEGLICHGALNTSFTYKYFIYIFQLNAQIFRVVNKGFYLFRFSPKQAGNCSISSDVGKASSVFRNVATDTFNIIPVFPGLSWHV